MSEDLVFVGVEVGPVTHAAVGERAGVRARAAGDGVVAVVAKECIVTGAADDARRRRCRQR